MKTTGTFTSTTTTTYKPATMDSNIKPALDSKISMSTQVAKGNSCESLHEDIGHRLSVQQEHKLDGLAAQRDRVPDADAGYDSPGAGYDSHDGGGFDRGGEGGYHDYH